MIINGHNHCHLPSQKMRKCQDYIQALELERTKIQVFQRELPLCLELVTQAIETCKQQMSSGTTSLNQSECSEQTSSDVPVYEEFMPIKRDSCHSDEDDEDNDDEQQKSNKKHKNDNNTIVDTSDKTCKKSDWLRSVQLWNQTPDPPTKLQNSPRKVAVTEVKRNGIGGAFHPFKKLCDTTPTSNCAVPPPPPAPPVAPVSTSSTAETGGSSGNNNINNNNNNNNNNNKDQGKDGSSHRKSRRCWSPELHRRFLQALQQLGGSHVATPKQIRELMKVDGLTNDEVKSHLQKYRLHTRRPTTSMHNTTNNNSVQTPQFVVVGGIWVPPEYANMATATTASKEMSGVAQSNNGIYAPIAALPPPFHGASASPKQKQQHKSSNSDERGSHSEGHVRCHSPETSSSTHTTTASPVY